MGEKKDTIMEINPLYVLIAQRRDKTKPWCGQNIQDFYFQNVDETFTVHMDFEDPLQQQTLKNVLLCMKTFLEIRSQKATEMTSSLRERLRGSYEACTNICTSMTSHSALSLLVDGEEETAGTHTSRSPDCEEACCRKKNKKSKLNIEDLHALFKTIMGGDHMFLSSIEALFLHNFLVTRKIVKLDETNLSFADVHVSDFNQIDFLNLWKEVECELIIQSFLSLHESFICTVGQFAFLLSGRVSANDKYSLEDVLANRIYVLISSSCLGYSKVDGTLYFSYTERAAQLLDPNNFHNFVKKNFSNIAQPITAKGPAQYLPRRRPSMSVSEPSGMLQSSFLDILLCRLKGGITSNVLQPAIKSFLSSKEDLPTFFAVDDKLTFILMPWAYANIYYNTREFSQQDSTARIYFEIFIFIVINQIHFACHDRLYPSGEKLYEMIRSITHEIAPRLDIPETLIMQNIFGATELKHIVYSDSILHLLELMKSMYKKDLVEK